MWSSYKLSKICENFSTILWYFWVLKKFLQTFLVNFEKMVKLTGNSLNNFINKCGKFWKNIFDIMRRISSTIRHQKI